MTRDDIIRMARESNFYDGEIDRAEDCFVHFAALVAAAEREAIITLLSGIDKQETEEANGWWETSAGADFGARILDAIRARGNQ